MIYDETNLDNSECHLFFPGDTLEDCYNMWHQETLKMNTGDWISSNLHSPNKIKMLESFEQYWM